MIIGSLLLLSLFFLPLWNITLEAPQYPDAIGMDIYINKFQGANPNDIKNINIMNHYVGMKDIPEMIPEFELFPYFVIGMSLLGIVFGLIGRRQLYLLWFIVVVALGSAAMYDFYLWEYDYGHNLKENAAIQFSDADGNPMAYQPPLIGNKMILNFKALSWPRSGAYLLFLGMTLSVLAFFKSKKKHEETTSGPTTAVVFLAFASTIFSCSARPQPINYGQDGCHYCKMTIVDKQHAAQMVTEKGKAYKYDAIECMMNHLKSWEGPPVQHQLVADFNIPGNLIDATKAHFIISESIPSPMGEFLTAFESTEKRNEVYQEGVDERLNWKQLRRKFSNY